MVDGPHDCFFDTFMVLIFGTLFVFIVWKEKLVVSAKHLNSSEERKVW